MLPSRNERILESEEKAMRATLLRFDFLRCFSLTVIGRKSKVVSARDGYGHDRICSANRTRGGGEPRYRINLPARRSPFDPVGGQHAPVNPRRRFSLRDKFNRRICISPRRMHLLPFPRDGRSELKESGDLLNRRLQHLGPLMSCRLVETICATACAESRENFSVTVAPRRDSVYPSFY